MGQGSYCWQPLHRVPASRQNYNHHTIATTPAHTMAALDGDTVDDLNSASPDSYYILSHNGSYCVSGHAGFTVSAGVDSVSTTVLMHFIASRSRSLAIDRLTVELAELHLAGRGHGAKVRKRLLRRADEMV